MVATTRHRKVEAPLQPRRASLAIEDGTAARGRRSVSHVRESPKSSALGKSSSARAAEGDSKKIPISARGRESKVLPGANDYAKSDALPIKKRKAPPVVEEESDSDSDAPEEVSKTAAQQLHEQSAAAMRMASQPDLVAKRAEKDRLRAATQAAQEAAFRRKATEVAAFEELPQDVLNAAAAVTLTLQQSLTAPRTNHIPLLPEISKKPTSR